MTVFQSANNKKASRQTGSKQIFITQFYHNQKEESMGDKLILADGGKLDGQQTDTVHTK